MTMTESGMIDVVDSKYFLNPDYKFLSAFDMNDVQNILQQTLSLSQDQEDLNHLISKLYKVWETNNAKNLELLKNKTIPYFGLHGAIKKKSSGILHDATSRIEMATFYEQPKDLQLFLFQLYDAISYVKTYAVLDRDNKEKRDLKNRGTILVYDLERESKSGEKENRTLDWEELYLFSDYHYLGYFSKNYPQCIKLLETQDNNWRRTDAVMGRDKIISGFDIQFRDFSVDDLGFAYISYFLSYQEIAYRILQSVMNRERE